MLPFPLLRQGVYLSKQIYKDHKKAASMLRNLATVMRFEMVWLMLLFAVLACARMGSACAHA